jgi:hypothetical protein
MEGTDQGFDGCFRRYTSGICVPSSPVGSRGRPGSLRFACAPWGGGGGDEETRTPDPLLAKEVLYQLSYVPLAPDGWWAFLDSNQRPLPYQGSALTS